MGTTKKKIISSRKSGEARRGWEILPSSKRTVCGPPPISSAIRPASAKSALCAAKPLVPVAPKSKELKSKEEYVDPILFEMGIFADKQAHHAATDALVTRIKSGKLAPRTPELGE